MDAAGVAVVVLGILVCTAGGLLAMLPDLNRPIRFVPAYICTMSLYLAGLAIICWYAPLAAQLRELTSGG